MNLSSRTIERQTLKQELKLKVRERKKRLDQLSEKDIIVEPLNKIHNRIKGTDIELWNITTNRHVDSPTIKVTIDTLKYFVLQIKGIDDIINSYVYNEFIPGKKTAIIFDVRIPEKLLVESLEKYESNIIGILKSNVTTLSDKCCIMIVSIEREYVSKTPVDKNGIFILNYTPLATLIHKFKSEQNIEISIRVGGIERALESLSLVDKSIWNR